jgi:hypothetical protein
LDEHHIYLSELALLGAFLSAPAYVAALVAQGFVLWRHGLGQAGHRRKLVWSLLISSVCAYLLTFATWAAVPPALLKWPGISGDFMLFGVFFVPAVIAATISCVGVGWYALRSQGAAQR